MVERFSYKASRKWILAAAGVSREPSRRESVRAFERAMKVPLAVTAVLAFGLGIGSAYALEAESEAAANKRGYQLLRSGDVQGAIAVFEENAASHPDSANVHDSLGEAYVAAGDTTRAVESYRKALAVNPRSRGARAALERLTGERPVLRPSVLFHVAAGVVGLFSGLAAM